MKTMVLRGIKGIGEKNVAGALLALLLAAGPAWVFALGLGEIKLRSALEEPFDAEIELTSASKDELKTLQVRLAPKEDFSRVGIKPVPAVNLLQFEVVEKPGGKAVVRITTPEPVHDPYLNFLVEANWGRGRVLREYTVLLDPPELAGEESPIIEAPPVAKVQPEEEQPESVVSSPEAQVLDAATPSPAVPEVVEPDFPPVEGEELLEESAPDVAAVDVIEPQPLGEEPVSDLDESVEVESLPLVEGEELIEPEASDLSQMIDVEEHRSPASETGEEEHSPNAGGGVPVVEAEGGEEAVFPSVGEVTVGTDETDGVSTTAISHQVRPGETLWSIAQDMREGRDATVYQVMMALFYNNPNAFIEGNVNNLKAGSILRVEDESEFSAISPATARAEFWQQYRAWQEYKHMLAENVITQGEGAPGAVGEGLYSSEEVAQLPEATTVEKGTEGGAQLKLVSPEEVDSSAGGKGETVTEGGSEAAISGSENLADLQAMREQVLAEIESSEAGSARNQALREKLAALEEQIASLQRVVSVKDSELAAMQQEIARETDATDDDGKAEEGMLAKLNRNPQLMGVLGGVALLLLAWLWLAFRRRGSDDSSAPAAAVSEGAAGGGSGVAFMDAEESATAAVADMNFSDKKQLLERVDAYIKEGKHAAAVDLLNQAAERHPGEEEYRYRLLDLYYEMKNKEGFQREAEELYSMTGGADRARWAKVAAMGAALLPAHALFADAKESPLAEEGEKSSDWEAFDEVLEGSSQDDDVMDDDQLVEEVLESESIADAEDDTAWEQGFDIEEEEVSETYSLEETILESASEEQAFDDEGIDFNLAAHEESGSVPEGIAPTGGEVVEFTRREGTFAGGRQDSDDLEFVLNDKEDLTEPELSDDLLADDEDSELLVLDGDEAATEYEDEADDELEEADEIGTKLDLARAYIDMGDKDAARSMLDEVKQEGDPTQKEEAEALLARLGS